MLNRVCRPRRETHVIRGVARHRLFRKRVFLTGFFAVANAVFDVDVVWMVLTMSAAFSRILMLLIIIITVMTVVVIFMIVIRVFVPLLWGDIVHGGGLEWCGSGHFVRWMGRLWEEVAVTSESGQWRSPIRDCCLWGKKQIRSECRERYELNTTAPSRILPNR